MGEFIRIASRTEMPEEGEAKEFEVSGRTICVANVDGTFAAMDNVCAHRGGPLGQGVVADGKLVCPWHGWMFDTRSGASDIDPNLRVPVYSLKIDGDDVLVDLTPAS